MRKIVNNLVFGFVLVAVLAASSSAQAFIFEDRVGTSKALAHYMMGQVYDLLGETNRAILEYQKAAQFDETGYHIRLRLGTDLARLNLLKDAKEQLMLAGEQNPQDLQSRYLLALIYSTEQDYDKAAAEYEYILKSFTKIEPENIEIYGYLGQLYYSQRKYDQAIEQFEKILVLEPENPDILYLLASLYLDVGREQESIDLLKKSIAIDPDHDGSLNTLGYIYAEKGSNLDEAQQLIEKALELSPNNAAYLDSLAWVYYKRENFDKALEILLQANDLMKDPVIYDHLGDVYMKLNRIDDAVEYWQQSLKLMPDQEAVSQKISQFKNTQASK